MSADALLARLERVRKTGPGRWSARCPAHRDRSPSLSVCEKEDGRILIRCFADCSFEEIIGAAGIEAQEMFPPRPIEHAPSERRPFLPQDVFEIARQEIGVAAIVAADMHRARTISNADYERLFVCVKRLSGIAEAAYARSY